MSHDMRAALAGPARCTVTDAPLPPLTRVPSRTDPAQVETLRRIVDRELEPPPGLRLEKAVSSLATAAPAPELPSLLAGVLADPAAPALARAVAALQVARAPDADAERVLLPHLNEPEPMIRLRVLDSLGAVGGTEALRALKGLPPQETPALRRQAELARRLITHRLGLTVAEPLELTGARWDPELDGPLGRLAVRRLEPEEAAARGRALLGRTCGIELDDRVAFAVGEGRDERHFLLNRELTGKDGWALLRERPTLAGLVTILNDPTGAEAVQLVVLTAPEGRELRIHGYRPDGALVFDGRGPLRKEGFPFTLTSTDRPGQCRYRVHGTASPRGLQLERVETLAGRRAKRKALPIG